MTNSVSAYISTDAQSESTDDLPAPNRSSKKSNGMPGERSITQFVEWNLRLLGILANIIAVFFVESCWIRIFLIVLVAAGGIYILARSLLSTHQRCYHNLDHILTLSILIISTGILSWSTSSLCISTPPSPVPTSAPTSTPVPTFTPTPTLLPPILISDPQDDDFVGDQIAVSGLLHMDLCEGCNIFVVIHPDIAEDKVRWYGQEQAATIESRTEFFLGGVNIGRRISADNCKAFEIWAVVSPENLLEIRMDDAQWRNVEKIASMKITVQRKC